MDGYLVASRKHTAQRDRYITFWRPARCGYAWPVSWAGVYGPSQAVIVSDAPAFEYPDEASFAIPASVVMPLCVSPRDGEIDRNAGPVLRNTKAHWALIEAHNALLHGDHAARVAGEVS